MAHAAGILVTWEDFDDLSRVTPLICRVYPNGSEDVNAFHAAGGMSFVTRTLLDAGLVHDDVRTVAGAGLRRYTQEPFLDGGQLVWRDGPTASLNRDILRPADDPFEAEPAVQFDHLDLDVAGIERGQGLILHGDSGNAGIEAELAREAQRFGTSGYFAASMKMADSDWINFIVRKSPATAPLTSGNLYLYALVAAVPLIICFWAVRQLVWPYRRLERAVHRLGEDLNAPEIPERGDYEVRSVIRAINTMQRRLKDHLSEREHLAAALAHDLRTPLTRMKIRCELSKSATVQLVRGDIREIERIVNSVLEFSRAGTASGPRDKVDLSSLVQDVCGDFPEAAFESLPPELARAAVVRANTTFLARAVTNL
eukprot:gene3944-5388_t